MKTAAFIFPHQLFKEHPAFSQDPATVFLIQNSLFFYDNKIASGFHRQKILLHLNSMGGYATQLRKAGTDVQEVNWNNGDCELETLCDQLCKDSFETVVVADPHDFLLEKRLSAATAKYDLTLVVLPTPAFLNTKEENADWRSTKKRWHMADFYQWQRRRMDILMEGNAPAGGSWSFDKDNRKKLPIKQLAQLPTLKFASGLEEPSADRNNEQNIFANSFGSSSSLLYPSTHDEADRWLTDFLQNRFRLFGDYEDAIEADQNWLYHSVLTPMLNVGLLEPAQVVERALSAAAEFNIPINSLEGFIRQVIGWREFMRATYTDLGVTMRTSNHWQHQEAMPSAFYNGTTGIEPVDNTINRVLETGYCHHIERLMILGGFMFLCEIHPNHIYRWFMELYIDSYDWVMVPNVYAMSQHADGGLITTKPYFSGSNYVLKMSHYKKSEWSEIWDALFWRWIHKNKKILAGNHRWSMMCKNVERMDSEKLDKHLRLANGFLHKLH